MCKAVIIIVLWYTWNNYRFSLLNAVPGHVSSFSGHSVNSSCIELSLRPPIMTGCNVIRYYQLSYQSLSGGGRGFRVSKSLTVSSPVANGKIFVCRLRVNILYKFQIAAVTEAGSGPPTVIRIYHYDPSFKWVVRIIYSCSGQMHMHMHNMHTYYILLSPHNT